MQIVNIKKRQKNSMDDNMIPLINIVFLMLIFFMVAGQIAQSEPVKVNLPNSISEKHKPEEPAVIVIGLDGKIAFEKNIVSQPELTALIKQRFDRAKDKEQFTLMVKVDGALPVEKLRGILTQIKQSGIKRVALATQQLAQ